MNYFILGNRILLLEKNQKWVAGKAGEKAIFWLLFLKSEGKPGTGEQLEGMQEKQKSEKTKKIEKLRKNRDFWKKQLEGRKKRKQKPY